ncbi:MAG: glycoside hydrolase family 31 protein [Mycobacterium leprae]
MRKMDAMTGWHWSNQTLTVQSTAGVVRLTPMTDDLIKMRIEAAGAWPNVLPSGAVVRDEWPAVTATVVEDGGKLTLSTARMRVEVGLNPLTLSWYDGEQLFARDEAILVGDNGSLSLQRTLLESDRFYGFGEKTGFLNKRGRKLEMWATDEPTHLEDADPLYQAIPFHIGLRDGYAHGLFVDSTAPIKYDLGSQDPAASYGIDVAAAICDLYVFAGPAIAEVIRHYTDLTGRMELPPMWTLGFHQCRWSYFPESMFREVADGFRAKDIPCDGMWLDIDYMDGYRVFTWDKARFASPERMLAEMGAQGFKVVTIVDPGVKVDAEYPVFQEGMAKDYFIKKPDGEVYHGQVWPGTTAFPDFMKPETRRWWGDLHTAAYYDKGIAGIWNDMNEPSSFTGIARRDRTLPHNVLQGEDGRQVPHKDVHNAYGFRMSQATYEGMKRNRPDRRPFILTRSGYAGIQRYAAVWMGDNHSWWQHLLGAMPMCMGMGLSGVPFVGTDVGGFSHDTNGELVARWMQLGAFTPFFRMHTAKGTRDQEPWSFGPEVEAISRKYIKLRYRLLPFFYTLFEEAHRTGLPIMRPLMLEHQADPETYHISDQFLVGRNVLVAPIYQPEVNRRLVYLPEGVWYDFWTGERYEGKQYVTAVAPLDTLPLYVRAGTALPMGPAMNYVGEQPMESLTLQVYAGQGTSEIYLDAGEGYGYRQGEYARVKVTVDGSQVTVGLPEGGFAVPWRQVEILFYGEGEVRRQVVSQIGGFTVKG